MFRLNYICEMEKIKAICLMAVNLFPGHWSWHRPERASPVPAAFPRLSLHHKLHGHHRNGGAVGQGDSESVRFDRGGVRWCGRPSPDHHHTVGGGDRHQWQQPRVFTSHIQCQRSGEHAGWNRHSEAQCKCNRWYLHQTFLSACSEFRI